MDQCTRETLQFIVYCLFSAALSWKWVWHPWALDGGSGAIKPVLWPYVWQHCVALCCTCWCMVRWLAVTVEGLDLMTTCSIAVKNMTITRPVQFVLVSSGSMAEECASQCRSVLAGRRSCDWYNQQGEPGSNYHRVIARLIYPTQCSKCPSGVLIFQFQSLS